jgi:hypothetical protein
VQFLDDFDAAHARFEPRGAETFHYFQQLNLPRIRVARFAF